MSKNERHLPGSPRRLKNELCLHPVLPPGSPAVNYQPLRQGTNDVENLQYGIAVFENYIWSNISFCFTGNEEVLDLGCGTGRHSKFLSPSVKKITAVDIAPTDIIEKRMGYDMRLIKDIPNVEYINMNFMNYDNQEKFDIVFAHGAFKYFYMCYKEPSFQKMISFLKKRNSALILIEGLGTRLYDLESLALDNDMQIVLRKTIPQWGSGGGTVSILTFNSAVEDLKRRGLPEFIDETQSL